MAAPATPPPSATSRVNSSTNSGTPSVRSATWSATSFGMATAVWACIISATWPRVSRFSATCVCNACPFHGGSYSGRAVNNASTCTPPPRSTNWVNRASVDGSTQCRSSTTNNKGLCSARAPSQSRMASWVFSRSRSGWRAGVGNRSPPGTDSRAANSA